MKSPVFFVGIYFVAVLCCWNFGISAAVSHLEIRRPDANLRDVQWICKSDEDCTTPNSTCVENKCQCQPDYIFSAEMTSCLKAATHYGDACEETSQCTAYLLAGGNCAEGSCSCVKGYHYLHGRCIKSSGLNEKCSKDDECYVNADYEALSCTGNICQCSVGFYKREHRTCRREAKEIGAECMIDLDCIFDESAKCDKKKGCLAGSQGIENITLRGIVHAALETPEFQAVVSDVVVGSNCTNDKECEVLGTAACNAAGKCICEHGHFANDKLTKCVPEIGEKCNTNDKITIKNSVCRDGFWGCKGANVPSRNNQLCRKVTTEYNKSCTVDEQCYVFGPDALCLDKKCLCNENSHYSEKNLFCWINRAVGEDCEVDEDCYVAGFGSKLSCKESICACPTDTHLNAAGTACISDTAALGDPCTANEDCSTLDKAVCLNDTCNCGDHYFDLSGKCVPGIGANCALDSDCNIQNSTCLSHKCTCMNGTVSAAADLCVRISSFGGECQYGVQCSAAAAGAICEFPEEPEDKEPTLSGLRSTEGRCTCDTGHHYKYSRCYRTKVLHEPCDSRGQCYVDSSLDSVMCLKGLCVCDWDAVEVNSTFCKTNASSTSVLSSLMVFTILLVKFIGFN